MPPLPLSHQRSSPLRWQELPWPTSILQEAAAKLRQDGRLTPAVAAAAQQRLETWLAKPTGALRTWCRETKPKILAACALLRASRDADASAGAAAGGASSGLIVSQPKGTAISAVGAAIAVGYASHEQDTAANLIEMALGALSAAGG